jgi:hypothetical protein
MRPPRTTGIVTRAVLPFVVAAAGFAGVLAAPGAALAQSATNAAARPARPPVPAPEQPADDREAVRRAVLDYVEGFYQGDSTRLRRSVWPDVRKYGYMRRQTGGVVRYQGIALRFPEEFMRVAADMGSGRDAIPADAPRDITLFDVQDQTASAKLRAVWGTDYLLLAKENGRWMITHVLWQATPKP